MSLTKKSAVLLIALLAAGLFAWKRTRKESIVILAVGESTTARGGEQGWTRVLENNLRDACPALNLKVQAFAISGADSSDLAARMGAGISIFHPDLMIAMAGANDGPGTADVTPEDIALFGAAYHSEVEMQDAIFHHILHGNPLNDRRYSSRFAQFYRDAGQHELAATRDEAVISAIPLHAMAALDLGNTRKMTAEQKEARRWHEWALAAELKQPHANEGERVAVRLAALEDLAPHWPEFERAYASLSKEFPNSPQVDFQVAYLYGGYGRWPEQEKVLKKILSYSGAGFMERLALHRLQENLFRQGKRETLKAPPAYEYPAATLRNLRKLYEQVHGAGIPLFLMQYPLRDPAPLRVNFGALAEGVISNQKGFEEARDPAAYDQFFVDRFAGDFGHFGPLSSRLVAENAAAGLLPWLKSRFQCAGRN